MSFGVDEFGQSLFEDTNNPNHIQEAKWEDLTRTDSKPDSTIMTATCSRCQFNMTGVRSYIETSTTYHEEHNEGHVIGWSINANANSD